MTKLAYNKRCRFGLYRKPGQKKKIEVILNKNEEKISSFLF